MTRLADMLIDNPVHYGFKDTQEDSDEYDEAAKHYLANAPVFCIDNVVEYLAGQDKFEIDSCPNIAPPYPAYFMEWNVITPSILRTSLTRLGALVVSEELPGGGWNSIITTFGRFTDSAGLRGISSFLIRIHADGSVDKGHEPQAQQGGIFNDERLVARYIEESWWHTVIPVLMATSFLHCKNVEVLPCEPPRKLAKSRERKGKRPLVRFHTLVIEPMKRVLRTEGQADVHGLRKALHICRGHFVTYTEERPLFGKVVGTFWKSSHVRGAASAGVVVKDYEIRGVH